MADTDQQALQIIEQRWGTDTEQPLGRLVLALREDECFSEFVDALAGAEDVPIPDVDLNAAFVFCERELSMEEVAVALGDAPGRGSLTPAEFLARWANEALKV